MLNANSKVFTSATRGDLNQALESSQSEDKLLLSIASSSLQVVHPLPLPLYRFIFQSHISFHNLLNIFIWELVGFNSFSL